MYKPPEIKRIKTVTKDMIGVAIQFNCKECDCEVTDKIYVKIINKKALKLF